MFRAKLRKWQIPIIVIGFCLMMTNTSLSQWSTPVGITSAASNDNNPAMTIAMGGQLFVTFQSDRINATGTPGGDNDIWVTYWDGTSWSSDIQISTSNFQDEYPDMTTDSNDQPWVVWQVPGGPYASFFNGANWTAPMRVHNGTLGGSYPDIAADGAGFVYVTWEYNNGVQSDIYCSQYNPGTGTWVSRRLTNAVSNENRPQVAVDRLNNNVYFFYMSDRDSGAPNTQSIYSRRLTGGAGSPGNFIGAALSVESRADTNDPANIYFDRPTSLIWDSFRSRLTGGWFSSGSNLFGPNQTPDVNEQPTGNPPWTTPPAIISSGAFLGNDSGCNLVVDESTNDIWATWTSTRDTNSNIYADRFDGTGWQAVDERVCQNTAYDGIDFYTQASPGICYDPNGGLGRVWTAWASNRDGNYNIYVANNTDPADLTRPFFQALKPAPNEQNVPLDTTLYFEVRDDYSGINIDSLIMIVEGSTVINGNVYDPNYVTIQQVNKFFTYGVTYTPQTPFNEGDEVFVYLFACDRGDNDTGNLLDRNCTAFNYSFHASDYAWPQFQHDTQHRGYGSFSAPDLPLYKWYITPGGYLSSPVIGIGDRVIFGGSDGFLNIFGANGSMIKRYNTGSDIQSVPALGSNGDIYVGTMDGRILALDSNYNLKWQRQTGGPISAPITITPAGIIIVGSEDTYVYALEANNNLIWNYKTTGMIRAAPTSDDEGNVYVATYDGKVYSIYNSALNWVYPTNPSSPITSAPTIDQFGTLVFGSWNGNLYGLNKNTGQLRDSYNVGTIIDGSPAVDINGSVYFGSGYSVYRLDWDTFTNNLVLGWQFTPNQINQMGIFNCSPCLSYASSIFSFSSVYIGNNSGIIFQLAMFDGQPVHSFTDSAAGAINKAPAIGRNNVIYITAGKKLYAFGPGTGNNPPVLSNGSVTPLVGNINTEFTYKVSYSDVDQDSPTVMRVYIDGSSHDMILSSGSAYNGIYTYTTTLGAGLNHTFYFYFADGKGGTATLVDPITTMPFDGPDVGNPQLTNGTWSGSCPTLTYSINYQDFNNALKALLYVDGANTDMLTAGLPPSMNYTAQTPPGVTANDYYCFEFTDTIGNIVNYPYTGGWIKGANCDDATDPSWATFKGNRLRTGVSEFDSTKGPDILWTYDVGSPTFSSPILDNTDNIYFGTYSGIFYAIDIAGNLLWTYPTGGSPILSTPSMDDAGNLYFGANNGKVYSLDNTGTLRWSFMTGGAVYGSPAISSPLDNGMGGTQSRVYIGSYDSKLYCLTTNNGNELWNYLNPKISPLTYSSPCIGPTGLIYFGSIDGTMWCIEDNQSAGILKWSYKTGAAIESTPTVTTNGNLIFGSSDNNLYNLRIFNLDKDTASGLLIPELNWSYTTGDSVPSSPAVNDINNQIYVGSRDNHIYSIYPAGSKRWDYIANDDIESSPVIDLSGNVLYASRDGKVYSRKPSGDLNWSFQDPGDTATGRPKIDHVFTSPAISSGGNVLFGGWNGYLYCLRTDDTLPYFQNETPTAGSTGVSIILPAISVDILDDMSDIDIDSIIMTVQNETVTPTITMLTPPPYGYNVSLNVFGQFQFGENVLVTVSGCDTGSMKNCNEIQWNFTMETDPTGPLFLHMLPSDGMAAPQNFIIRLYAIDLQSGVDESTIKLYIQPSNVNLWIPVTPSIDPVQNGYFIEYDYPGQYPLGLLSIMAVASDKAMPIPNPTTYIYTVNVIGGPIVIAP
jgi:outer membrane protein assembly factor BamB